MLKQCKISLHSVPPHSGGYYCPHFKGGETLDWEGLNDLLKTHPVRKLWSLNARLDTPVP